jgi:hypothetical protein
MDQDLRLLKLIERPSCRPFVEGKITGGRRNIIDIDLGHRTIIGHSAGRLRRHRIKLLPGDMQGDARLPRTIGPQR